MGIKDNYILHEMNGEYVIIEISDGALEFSHVFYINSSIKMLLLLKCLKNMIQQKKNLKMIMMTF